MTPKRIRHHAQCISEWATKNIQDVHSNKHNKEEMRSEQLLVVYFMQWLA